MCSVKKVFLEILQNSQENTCARVSFLIKLNKNKAHFNWQKYKYQRIFCLNLLPEYFSKLNVKDVADNKLFRKNVKQYFSDKGSN